MGCAGSKPDDQEAVALCSHRLQHLAEAIERRYALAEAHASYIGSLRCVGLSLHRFFLVTEVAPTYPVLALPPRRKRDPLPPPSLRPAAVPDSGAAVAPETAHRLSDSNSGSHLQFRSSEDDDDDGSLHSERSSPLQHDLDIAHERVTTTTAKTYFSFAREQRPFSTDVNPVRVGGGDPTAVPTGSSYPFHHADPSYFNQNQDFYGGGGGYPYAYPHPYPPGDGVTGDGFFGSSQPPTMSPPPPAAASPPSSRAPTQPPSPPSNWAWDFLNPFETYGNYQRTYTPGPSSRDLGEEEGVPELEDEEQEVIEKAYGDEKYAAGASTSATNGSDLRSTGKSVAVEEGGRSVGRDMDYRARSSGTGEGEVHPTQQNAVVDEVLQRQSECGLRREAVPGSRSVPDAVHEIREQFERASASCEEISKMLEVGKLPYHRSKYEVAPTKMRHAIVSSLTATATSLISTSKTSDHPDNASLLHLDFDDEKGMKSGNLSSTLQKLYIWEKKLLEEVKAEEMIRLHHDRKSKQLMQLSDKGAENHKMESTQRLVMKLSSKIRIAIEVVDSISNTIGKLRDEELWHQLYELIQGLIRMWKVMSECHRSQCHAVIESKSLDPVVSAFAGTISDAQTDATMHLGLELLNWINIFFSWFDAQKCFVRTLNDWLMKCLPQETEETTDGIAPFSPGRLGAPPVFVICNHWSQIIDKISEREVVKALWLFISSILQFWQRHYEDSHHRLLTNREKDRHLKALEKDDQKIHKAVEALNRRLAIIANQSGIPSAGEIIHLSQATEVSSLQRTLQETFEAMERFSECCMKAYEELEVRFEEENATRGNARAS